MVFWSDYIRLLILPFVESIYDNDTSFEGSNLLLKESFDFTIDLKTIGEVYTKSEKMKVLILVAKKVLLWAYIVVTETFSLHTF